MLYKKGKYGNKKIEVDGVKFDSKLEMFCYNLFKDNNIDFDFQHTIVLIDKFKYNGESIRAITIIVDFVLRVNDCVYYVDSKGFPTEVSKIKYKMLRNQLKDFKNTDVLWLKSQKQAIEFVNKIKQKQDEYNQQSGITW